MDVITINRNEHTSFLADHRTDPITKDLISVGDRIVVCANCKTVYLESSWNIKGHCFLDQKRCSSKETLNYIPVIDDIKKIKGYKKRKILFIFLLSIFVVIAALTWNIRENFDSKKLQTYKYNISNNELIGNYTVKKIQNDNVINTSYAKIEEVNGEFLGIIRNDYDTKEFSFIKNEDNTLFSEQLGLGSIEHQSILGLTRFYLIFTDKSNLVWEFVK